MSDDDDSNSFGGFVPIPPDALASLLGVKTEEAQEKEEMAQEANDLRMRAFVENLTDDQAETLLWLFRFFAAEGQNNYHTVMFLGILKADLWRRKPIAGLDEA